MSRSRKKNPVTGVSTAPSEKADKRRWHRAFRRAARAAADAGEGLSHRQFSSPWWMAKDGKAWWGDMPPYMRRK